MSIDHKKRAKEMHRRAQRAEGALARAQVWIELGLKQRRIVKTVGGTAEVPAHRVPRWFLTEALKEMKRT